MIVLNIFGYFGRNKQNSYAALKTAFVPKALSTCNTKLDINQQDLKIGDFHFVKSE